jgi:hypothetical protein
MADDSVARGFQAKVLANLVGADDVGQRSTRQPDGVRAGLIGLFAADSDWAHK